jgi:hypothetical protein
MKYIKIKYIIKTRINNIFIKTINKKNKNNKVNK